MTQSDAPNEGREEKELAEINKLHVSLSNEELIKKCNEWVSSLAKTGGKSWLLHIPVSFNEDPDMLFTELSARFNNGLVKDSMLRDQLSERQQQLDATLRNTTRLLDQLSKEREMRKELVDAFKELLENDEFLEQFSTTSKEIEALIKKSSSL